MFKAGSACLMGFTEEGFDGELIEEPFLLLFDILTKTLKSSVVIV